jgi:hypothetical protein
MRLNLLVQLVWYTQRVDAGKTLVLAESTAIPGVARNSRRT